MNRFMNDAADVENESNHIQPHFNRIEMVRNKFCNCISLFLIHIQYLISVNEVFMSLAGALMMLQRVPREVP